MRRRAAAILLGLLPLAMASSCTARSGKASEAGTAPGAGRGARETCVVIDASNEPAGLAGERAWLHEKFPGWRMKSQGLRHDDDRTLDLLVVIDAAGAEHTVCFDITSWFGKF